MDEPTKNADSNENKFSKWFRLLELLSFAMALFFVVPPIPSACYSIDFLPGGIIASAFFLISRYLRDKCSFRLWQLPEFAVFLAFAWGIKQVANILYYCVE